MYMPVGVFYTSYRSCYIKIFNACAYIVNLSECIIVDYGYIMNLSACIGPPRLFFLHYSKPMTFLSTLKFYGEQISSTNFLQPHANQV